MRCGGFVLLGGQSRRMGRDKALLPFGETTLAQHAAERVLAAAGSVTLIGSPSKYGHLGYPVIPDLVPNCGPLGGIHAALSSSIHEWNLILAVDLPYVSPRDLKALLETATGSGECVILQSKANQLQPLCGAYHRSCLLTVDQAIKDKRLRVMDLIPKLKPIVLSALEPASLFNVNTPAEWRSIQHA